MNILVTGANGQLGSAMRLVASGDDRFIFTDVVKSPGVETEYLDITDIEAVRRMVALENVDAIVNCAAFSNVEEAENNVALVERLNADAPENLALVMKECDGLLIHISTDYIFGGKMSNVPYKEDEKGAPTNVYGLTKIHGEDKVMATGCKYIIIRTSWLYSEYGRNFCKTMMSLTSTKPDLKVVFDQVGTPTYAHDLAEAIKVILDDYSRAVVAYDKSGIYHYSNEGVCSWYDFARMIAEFNGTTSCDVHPCHSNEFPSRVIRPSYSVLDKTKIKETFGISIPYWTDSLRKCIDNLKG